jgi:hypothetical protein
MNHDERIEAMAKAIYDAGVQDPDDRIEFPFRADEPYYQDIARAAWAAADVESLVREAVAVLHSALASERPRLEEELQDLCADMQEGGNCAKRISRICYLLNVIDKWKGAALEDQP